MSYNLTRKRFLEAMAAVPKWGEPIDSQVREYCDGLGNRVRTNYKWNFESERYFGTQSPEIQSKKCISLTLKDHLKDSKEIGPVLVDCSLLYYRYETMCSQIPMYISHVLSLACTLSYNPG
jgi:hypothetical protein